MSHSPLDQARYHRLTADFLEACAQPDGSCQIPDGMRVQYCRHDKECWRNCEPKENWTIKVSPELNPGNLYLRLVAKPSKKRKKTRS